MVCARATINGETRWYGVEDAPLCEPMIEMSFAGVQARDKLLGIAVSVESSSGTTPRLVPPMFLC